MMEIDQEETKVTLTSLKEVELIQLIGDLDLYNIPALKKVFENLNKNNRNKILIDLLNAKFIDSSGLGVLVSQALYLQKRNLVLKFINVNSTIDHIFSMGGFTRSFKRFPSKKMALLSTWNYE